MSSILGKINSTERQSQLKELWLAKIQNVKDRWKNIQIDLASGSDHASLAYRYAQIEEAIVDEAMVEKLVMELSDKKCQDITSIINN